MGARPFIDFRKWAVRSTFTGSDIGPVYTVYGRGGMAIAQQFNTLEGAVYYQPRLPVQSITQGRKVSGSYSSQPLAVPPKSQ